MSRCLINFDSAYNLEDILSRGQLHQIYAKSLNGYFDEVFTVNPFGKFVGSVTISKKFVVRYQFNENHIFLYNSPVSNRIYFPSILQFIISQFVLAFSLITVIKRRADVSLRAGDPIYLGLFALFLSKILSIKYSVRVPLNYDVLHFDLRRAAFPRLTKFILVEQRIISIVLKNAAFVVAPSEDNLRYAIKMGARPDRSRVIRYGSLIDPGHFNSEDTFDAPLTQSYWNPQQEPVVLLVARLEKLKYIEDFIRAIGLIRDRGIPCRGVVAGEGPLRSELEALSKSICAPVELAGSQRQEWLIAAYRRACVVVSTCTGRALTEAGLAGAAVVAYDYEWQSELISDGETGSLVEFRNVTELASAVAHLLANPSIRRRYGNSLKLKTRQLMSPSHWIDLECDLYRSFGK